MFPISKETLSFREISDYWSREIKPPASPTELLNLLINAWWRGEIVGDGPPRVQFLSKIFRSMSKSDYPSIVFTSGHEAGPSQFHMLPDGGAVVDIRPRIRVPSSTTDAWDEAACDPAFRSLGEIEWVESRFELLFHFGWFNLSRDEFMKWVTDRRYLMPTFWAGDAAGATQLPQKPASESMIRQAINNVYDSVSEPQKPPNVKEISRPVQKLLSSQGYKASGRCIQQFAGEAQYKERRRKPGRTIASETRSRKK
jgi:hypothetical protein